MLDLFTSKYLVSMTFYGIVDYATGYATLLLHNERGKSCFNNELISAELPLAAPMLLVNP